MNKKTTIDKNAKKMKNIEKMKKPICHISLNEGLIELDYRDAERFLDWKIDEKISAEKEASKLNEEDLNYE